MSTIRELADYYVARLASQYRLKNKAPAHVGLFAKQMLADALAMEINPAFDLETAQGVQLDIIGKYVGVSRDVQVADSRPYFGFVTADYPAEPQNPNGFVIAASLSINAEGVWYECEFSNQSTTQLSDYQYRQLIKIKISTNSSDNTMASLQTLIATFFNGQIQCRDNKDMTMAYFYGTSIQLPLSVLQTYLPRPMGVGITVARNIAWDATVDAVAAFNSETPDPLIDFGLLTATDSKVVTITNATSTPFTITALSFGSIFSGSGETPALPVTLLAGETFSFTITATITGTGVFSTIMGMLVTSDIGSSVYAIELAARCDQFIPSPFADWAYKKTITIDHTLVAGNLAGFPVLVSLPTDADLAANAQSTGNDIVFTLADGETQAYHELEKFVSATGQLVAWVNVPNVSASVDTQIVMFYGNPLAPAQQNPARTWDGGYVMVQHLDENPAGAAPQFIDSAPVPTDLASSMGFTSRWTVAGSSDPAGPLGAQGVATDGTYIYYCATGYLQKYDQVGNLLISHDTSTDAPLTKEQTNGVFYHEGKLYVGAGNHLAGTPYTSWIVEYDADTLDYITHHLITPAFSGNEYAFTEGCAFHDGAWWVCWHASKYVSKFDTSWNWVADYAVNAPQGGTSGGWGPGLGYDGIAWRGEYLYLNIHELQTPRTCDVYRWNGTGFDIIERVAQISTSATQGLCFDPIDSSVVWWAERNYSGLSGVAKGTFTAAGFAKNNGTATNGPTSGTGKIDAAVQFDGTNDYVACGTNQRVSIIGPLTVEAWVKPTGASNYSGVIGRHTGLTNTGFTLRFGIGADGRFNGWVGDGTNAYAAEGSTAGSSGNWYHVALVYDMQQVKIFVNGVWEDVVSDAFTGLMTVSANAPFLGRYAGYSSNYYLNGVIDEARMSNTARSANWLLTQYRNQNSPATFYALGAQQPNS